MTERRLTPADAVWLYSEFEANHQTVSAVVWTDRLIDPDAFTALVQERLVDRYPTFHQRIRKSRNPLLMPHWEDDPDFDIAHHIEVMQLPAPADKGVLEEVIGEQRSLLLNHRQPLWKIYVIQGYNGDTTAIHARIQHAIADGWALVRLVLSLADESEDIERPDTIDRARRRKRDVVAKVAAPALDAVDAVSGAVAKTADAVQDALTRTADLVSDIARDPTDIGAHLASGQEALDETLSIDLDLDPGRFLEFGSAIPDSVSRQFGKVKGLAEVTGGGAKDAIDFLNPPKPGKTILHGEATGRKLVAWIDPIPLQDVKDIGRTLGATINDVLLGVLTNALRRYLLEKDALTVDELLTSVPVSLRKPDEPLPRTLGNRFGLIPVLLPVGIEDPVEQVRSLKDQIDDIKQSQLPIVSFGLTSASAIVTPDVERAIHKVNQAHSIGVTTNVPGPRHELYLAGAKVLGMFGMGGMSGNMNLSFAIFSLNGEINFGVSSDAAITDDPQRILDHFVASIAALKEATGVGAA